MLIVGLVFVLLPRFLDLADQTGLLAERFRSLPFYSDPFTFAGGLLLLWSMHLLAVVRKCSK
jgi:hypothetical protein